MLATIDYIIIGVYIIGVAAFGILVGGRQKSASDYFLGGRSLPWWAVCFSVVATETSTLTVIGIPAVSYGGTLTFLQLTFGYLAGRVLVSLYFLPKYFKGEMYTAYTFLGQRYGSGMQATASVTFLLTRLLADGVRLFATAIPLKVIADAAGLTVGYFEIILVIGLITIAYTLIGGIKAVVWMDVVQMGIYVGGALFAVVLLWGDVPANWWQQAAEAGKAHMLNIEFGRSFADWITQPYAFVTAVIGGAIFSMASHGTDQLIVQRLLTCRDLRDGQRALIVSGFVVLFQFALFLLVGLLLWAYYNGAPIADLGLSRGDEIFPKYIIEGLPPGVSGILLAGIIAAAMSTLSSSLNALASSTMMDLYDRFSTKALSEAAALKASRGFTLFWGIIFIAFANLFEDQQNPVVELGLAIASYTYGGLLGVFALGMLNKHTKQADAIIAFVVTIVAMVLIIFGVRYSPEMGWLFIWRPTLEEVQALGLVSVGWPWYTAIGAGITLAVGSLLALRHK